MSEVTELLTQIAEHTKPDNNAIWIAAISSASALIGAGIGALLLYRGTAKQVEATNKIEESSRADSRLQSALNGAYNKFESSFGLSWRFFCA